MPTPHENHSFWRREHIVTANRTVTLRRALYASMRVLDRDRKTDTARLDLTSASHAGQLRWIGPLPCSGRNPSPGPAQYGICHSHCNDICSCLRHCPRVYRRDNSTAPPVHHNVRMNVPQVERAHTTCTAYALFLAGQDGDPRLRRGRSDRCTISYTHGTAT